MLAQQTSLVAGSSFVSQSVDWLHAAEPPEKGVPPINVKLQINDVLDAKNIYDLAGYAAGGDRDVLYATRPQFLSERVGSLLTGMMSGPDFA